MIVIRTPSWRLILLLLSSALFVAGGVWLLVGPRNGMGPKKEIAPVLGAIGIALGGLSGGIFLRRLLSHRIAVVIDRVGVIDNASAIPAGRIAWDEITKVEITKVMRQSFLGIDVQDRAALYARVRGAVLLKANAKMVGFPVNIPSVAVDRPIDDLCRVVQRYWQNPHLRSELESSSGNLPR